MKRASIAELKARLSEFVAAARRGEDVLITDRGRPVARLAPLRASDGEEDRIAALVRAGVLNPPRGKLPRDFLTRALPTDPKGKLRKAVLDERSEGW